MKLSQLISGIVLILLGIFLIVLIFFNSFEISMLILIFWAIIVFVLGIVILINKNEDKIESIKRYKGVRKNE